LYSIRGKVKFTDKWIFLPFAVSFDTFVLLSLQGC
jgi:hypothetical protein